jgi:hypothetical protein
LPLPRNPASNVIGTFLTAMSGELDAEVVSAEDIKSLLLVLLDVHGLLHERESVEEEAAGRKATREAEEDENAKE